MKNKRIIKIIGAVIGLTAFILAWYYYDFKLAIIIFLSLLGNNMERHS